MTHWFERIALRRIDEAAARGQLSGLRGEGKPLDRDRLRETSEDVMYRMMSDAGFLPPELQMAKDIEAKRAVLDQIEDEAERSRLKKQIALLELRRGMAADQRRRFAAG